MAQAKLRIEGEGGTPTGYRLWLDDVELTNVTSAISLDMSVGDANTVTFTVFVNGIEVGADVEALLVRAKGKERTSFASRFREWLR